MNEPVSQIDECSNVVPELVAVVRAMVPQGAVNIAHRELLALEATEKRVGKFEAADLPSAHQVEQEEAIHDGRNRHAGFEFVSPVSLSFRACQRRQFTLVRIDD